ncbi:hypothetical protein GCM10011533_02450 [Streptosporangium jomthongense]|uniref:Uncharacterized protein n=1 Tax=Marinobacter aromaticivorans TaxID=1494078 RepID=A0ABW2IQF1_9GAMM|nr:hypothetical protein [Marinobacter aromaticivorans]GGE53512.1 hypothetical protein GCM10011533_02450 [Streptosporangium jomthongense]
MTFSISGIFAVLSYAIQPFVTLILAVLAVLVIVQLVARSRHYRAGSHSCTPAAIVALLAGLATVWLLPMLTSSRVAFVTTVVDWLALIAASLGVALIVWLILHPLSYLVRGARQS